MKDLFKAVCGLFAFFFVCHLVAWPHRYMNTEIHEACRTEVAAVLYEAAVFESRGGQDALATHLRSIAHANNKTIQNHVCSGVGTWRQFSVGVVRSEGTPDSNQSARVVRSVLGEREGPEGPIRLLWYLWGLMKWAVLEALSGIRDIPSAIMVAFSYDASTTMFYEIVASGQGGEAIGRAALRQAMLNEPLDRYRSSIERAAKDGLRPSEQFKLRLH